MISVEQMLLSVLANAIGLIGAKFMRTAPPRVLLYLCIVSMLAIFVPWAVLGSQLSQLLSITSTVSLDFPAAAQWSGIPASASDRIGNAVMLLWLAIAAVWLLITLWRSNQKRRQWLAIASRDESLARLAAPMFKRTLKETRVHRLPNSDIVIAAGTLRPEVWIGDQIRTDSQLKLALNHELCHIASKDHLALFLIVLVERLLWWNPLVWLLGKQARMQMEYACDARCQSFIGATQYRRTLAEMLLRDHTNNIACELPLGNKSDLINRMERIGMVQSLGSKHLMALVVGGCLVASASTSLATQDDVSSPTLMQCHDLLPKGVQYEFKLLFDIDTREGQQGKLSLTLLDPTQPDSRAVPKGADAFVRCVQQIVGVGEGEGTSET